MSLKGLINRFMTRPELERQLDDLRKTQQDEVKANSRTEPLVRIAIALEKSEVVLEFIALVAMQLLDTAQETEKPEEDWPR